MTLAVQFDLSCTHLGYFEVCNTEKRRIDALNLLDTTLQDGVLSKKDAQVLRGRLGFAYSQIFGLSGKLALQHISEHAFRKPFCSDISRTLIDSLTFLRGRLCGGVPRRVFKDVGNTFVILSDASFELNKTGGIGGVLLSADCRRKANLVVWVAIIC